MFRVKFADSGLWYTKSHKDEKVSHLFRVGVTTFNGMKIYEVIIWKLMIQWSF